MSTPMTENETRYQNAALADENKQLLDALWTALAACRAYAGAADTRTFASAKTWHAEAETAYQKLAQPK